MSAGNLPAKPVQDHAEPGAIIAAPIAPPSAAIDAQFEMTQSGIDAGRPMRAPPILGALTVIFGVTALYKATLLLAPIALVLGMIALLRRQSGWGLIGMGAAAVALAITPAFWALLGLAWLLQRYGWLLTYLG